MFYLINYMDFCKYMHILNLMPATKDWERSKTPVCSIPQVNRLIDNRLWHHDWVLKGVTLGHRFI